MSAGAFRYSESLQIAVVDFVSPDEMGLSLMTVNEFPGVKTSDSGAGFPLRRV